MSTQRPSTNRTPNHQETMSDWDDCPQGELSQMVRKLGASQTRARNRKLFQTGVVSMVLVACGVVVVGSMTGSNSMSLGGITCSECVSSFAEYHAHVTGVKPLEDSKLATSLATHLAHCQMCQSRFNENYPGVLESVSSASPRPRVHNLLPLLAVARQPTYY